MFSDPIVEKFLKLFSLHPVLLMVPPKLLQVQVHKIIQILFFGVYTTNNEHIPTEKSGSMTSSGFNAILIMHFKATDSIIKEIDQEDSVVAISWFSAFVVVSHAPEHHGKSVFVQDCWVIAPCPFTRNRLNPAVC